MTLILDLPPEVEARLTDEAKREGLSLEDYALRKLTESDSGSGQPGKGSAENVLRLVQRFKDSLPVEEWNGLPADLATNYKEHLRARRASDK